MFIKCNNIQDDAAMPEKPETTWYLVSRDEEYIQRSWADLGFQNQGARSLLGRILGSGDCFDAPSHIYPIFLQ